MEAFQVPEGYEETATTALTAYAIIQEEGARTRQIGQVVAKRLIENINRTKSQIEGGFWLEGDEVTILQDALTEYVRLQKELATIRRLSAKARAALTQKGEELLKVLTGEEVLANI